jgi:hypothetical protein
VFSNGSTAQLSLDGLPSRSWPAISYPASSGDQRWLPGTVGTGGRLCQASVAGTAGEGDRHDLLACGYSSGQLHRWARALDMQSDATLADLLAEGGPGGSDLRGARSCHLGSRPPNPGIPPRRDRRTELRCAAVSAARGGAFVYSFTVKDAVAAARAAGAKVRLLEARRSYARGARKRLEPVGPVWIAGHTGSLSLLRPERGVNVLPLVSEKTCTRSTRATGLTRLWSSSGTRRPCRRVWR